MTHKCQLWSVDNISNFSHQSKGGLVPPGSEKTNFPILSAKLHLLIEFSVYLNYDYYKFDFSVFYISIVLTFIIVVDITLILKKELKTYLTLV